MRMPMPRLHLTAAILFGIYLLLYPGSIILVALDRVPVWGTWMGGALLIMQGTLMGLWLAINFGRWGVGAALWILFLSWAIEHIGATTGFPFGTYTYTDVLQPQVLGVVPLAIPFAWLLIVTAATGVSEQVFQREGRTPWHDLRVSRTRVLSAASFALLLDVTIEPFAVHINHYWVWAHSSTGAYYGIPASNFIAWFITSLVLAWVLLLHRRGYARALLARPQREPIHTFLPWLPLTLYLTNLTMFVVVNMARDQSMAALIGGLILLVIALDWLLPRIVRRLRGARRRSEA